MARGEILPLVFPYRVVIGLLVVPCYDPLSDAFIVT
jgi:hypothetical protein